MAARTFMIQGAASHVGKSVLVTALCRVFVRRGLRVAPFKAQNMSNNSFVTTDGREIGRAQAVQAAACRLAPRTDFNPVLIKPEGERRAQLVVHGHVAGSLTASDYGRVRREYFHAVRASFARLAAEFELVILEGAGSPAEINLREQDVVNMRMAKEAKAPVVLVGDIDRGGVFATLVGTLALLEPDERRHVKGWLINKFRGDPDVLAPGIRMLEARTALPCLGVLPHCGDLRVPQEDSLGWDSMVLPTPRRGDLLTIGVADVPAISNFTDFEALVWEPDVQVVRLAGETDRSLDALIFPGTKNTAQALHFVKVTGLDRVARRVVAEGGTVVGICGGYQILGKQIRDPRGIESPERELDGLGLLDVVTSFARKKVLIQVVGSHRESGCSIEGYQVHMGRTRAGRGMSPLLDVQKPDQSLRWAEGASSADGRVFGTYVHGLFDAPAFRRMFLNRLRARRGWAPLDVQTAHPLDQAVDDVADFVARHVDLPAIEAIIERGMRGP
jgi:adenosylcobyric acid synthase